MNGQLSEALKSSEPTRRKDASVVRQRKPSSDKTLIGAVFSTTARLLLWYTVLTAILRCPSSSSDLNDDSPRICKPYLQLREQVAPHIEPQYNVYLKPYVEKARPHISRFNEKVFTPAATFTKNNYDIYGAPRVAQLQSYTDEAWKDTLKPRLEIRRQWATEQYEKNLAPHVQQVTEAANPYITKAKSEVVDIYESTIVPLFERVLPYLQKAYAEGHHITADVVLPYVRTANRSTLSFLNRRIWPQLIVLYGENVEPQLMKISERLGRYKDSKKLQAVVDETELDGKPASTASSATSVLNQSAPTPSAGKEVDTREKIESDLKTWQEKLAKAADKGAEDLRGRVTEITSRQIDNQAHGVGKALVVQLEETASSATEKLLEKINEVVKGLPEEADEKDEDAAYEGILTTIRAAGTSIRERAQAVRTWKQSYDHDTTSLVEAALESTLKVIDNIRDLGLQEIGMRWAWMEGVTYEDWSKYHDLKSTFDAWRSGVETVARQHKGLSNAQEEGENVQETAMEAAEKAAKELTRLKEVARWKIDARDSSLDFSSRVLPPKVKKVAQSFVDKVATASESVSSSIASALPSSQDTVQSFSSVAISKATDISDSGKSQAESVLSAAKSKTEEISSAVIGTPAPPSKSIVSDVSSKIQSASSAISDQASTGSRKVFGGAMAANVEAKQIILENDFVDDDTVSDKIQSMVSRAGGKAADLTNAVSEALQLKPTKTQGTVESITSLAGDQYEKAFSAASSALYGTTPGIAESLSIGAAEKYAQAVTAASYAIYGTPTPILQSLQSLASAQYEDAIRLARDQYTKASAGIVGTPKPAYEQALSSIQSVYSGSLSAASIELQSALGHTASFTNLWAKPTQGAYESISSVASSRLQAGLSQASAQYESAKGAIGAQPTPAHQQYLAEAQKHYYQGVGLAHDQYSRFLSAASTAVYGTPTPAYASLLSGAQAQYTAAVAAASSKYDELLSQGSSLAGKTSKSPAQSALDSASSQYDSIIAKASKAFADASSAINEGTHGKEKYNYLLSGAAKRYSSGISAASSQLDELRASASSAAGLTSKTGPERALETASSQYNAALSAASEALAAASSSASVAFYGTSTGNAEYLASVASEQLYGRETPWTEAVAAQASANWDAIVSKASEQIYGEPTPWHESAWSQAGGYAAQATDAAAVHYAAVQALFSELIVGKEPDFTESAWSRLSSAYSTNVVGYASSASSYASDVYASASSVVTSVFTPPPTLEAILGSASEQLNSAVEAASVQIYGSELGHFEKAKSAATEAYSTAQSKASEAIYGTQPSYPEAAQSSLADVAASAQSAISEAIYGTPTGTVEAAGSSVASAYSSISSVAAENISAAGDAVKDSYSAAGAKVSEAIYGPQQGAYESAASRISAAVESARARLSILAESATGAAGENLSILSKSVESVASNVGSAASEATNRVKDEL